MQCPAIPIGIKKHRSDDIVLTYMGMDTFATVSYIDQDLLTQIKYDSFETSPSLTTMLNKSSSVTARVVNDLLIVSLNGSKRKLVS